jgi:hypothetical protein
MTSDDPSDDNSVVQHPGEPQSQAERAAGSGTAPATRDSEQSQLDLGVISTGAADVDRAIGGLEAISERPVDEHAEVYESVLSELTAAMDDSGPSGS